MFDSGRRSKLQDIVKPINFRPIALCALSLMLGIILFRYSPSLKAWTVITPILAVIIVGVALWFFLEKEHRLKALITCAICLAFILVGIATFGIYQNLILKNLPKNGVYTVQGEVKSVSYKDGEYFVGLKDCVYDGEVGEDLFLYGISQEVGLYDVLSVKCEVYKAENTDGVKISNSVINGSIMQSNKIYKVEIIGKSQSLASKFKSATDQIFINVLGENGGILSALLRGDTSVMKGTVQLFRLVGIAHIFAVSGLHIGLIYVALTAFFRKIKIRRWIKTFSTIAVIFFYSYLCGFTPSSLRAVIICSCLALSNLYGEKYDGVNALSESAIIILVLRPSDLFSAGFILSFAIAFSIITLSPPIQRTLGFLPEKFASAIAVLFSSQAVALPLSVVFFGGFSLVSFFANFVLLPVVTILFYFVVIGTLFCLILPINELIALFVPTVMTTGIVGVTEFIARFPLQIDYFPKIMAIGYIGLLLVASDLINLPRKVKFSCLVIALTLVFFAFVHSFFG